MIAKHFPFMFSSLVAESDTNFDLSERDYEVQMIYKNHLIYEKGKLKKNAIAEQRLE